MLEDIPKNKRARGYHFPPLPISLVTWTPVRTDTAPTLPTYLANTVFCPDMFLKICLL